MAKKNGSPKDDFPSMTIESLNIPLDIEKG